MKLLATWRTGDKYVYYGATKKGCWIEFHKKWADKRGFVKFEFVKEN